MARRFFWNDGDPETGHTRGRMFVEDGLVVLEIETWDREDQRSYDYYIKFSVADYRRVWRQLRQGKGGQVEGVDGGWLSFSRNGERVEMALRDTPSPSNTPGGSSLSGSVCLGAQFNQIVLTVDELVGPKEPLRLVFRTLKALVAVGIGKVEAIKFKTETAGLDPTELLELSNLFQDTELLLAAAGQAEVDRWMESARNDISSWIGFGLIWDICYEEFKFVARGIEEVTGRIRAMVTQLQSLATTRAEEFGSLVDQVDRTRIYYKSEGKGATVTFLGAEEEGSDWLGGRRVFTLKPTEFVIGYTLSAHQDFFARTIGPMDDSQEMSGANSVYLFTRSCEEWLRVNQDSLRQKLQ